MKLSAILALIAGTEAVKYCREDFNCASNWTQKKCCSHFKCNVYCNTTRCRTDTCGKTRCAKPASGFRQYTLKRTIIPKAVPRAVVTYDRWGRPVHTAAVPVAPPRVTYQTCVFPSNGIAFKPSEDFDELAEFRVDPKDDIEALFESHLV